MSIVDHVWCQEHQERVFQHAGFCFVFRCYVATFSFVFCILIARSELDLKLQSVGRHTPNFFSGEVSSGYRGYDMVVQNDLPEQLTPSLE